MDLNPATNPDAQEALSKCYGNYIVILVPLKNGRLAVMNNARELCGIVSAPDVMNDEKLFRIMGLWYPPSKPKNLLEELGL